MPIGQHHALSAPGLSQAHAQTRPCILRFTTASLVCLIAAGCSTATMVRRDARGGEIAVQGSFMHSMTNARTMAVEHCHGRVTLGDRQGPEQRVRFSCVRRVQRATGAPVGTPTKPSTEVLLQGPSHALHATIVGEETVGVHTL